VRDISLRIAADALVIDPVTLRHLIGLFGSGQLIVGSDYPFAVMEHQPVRLIEQLDLPDVEKAGVLYKNAARFLGLSEVS